MSTSFGAICNDFYINHKLMLKMDLPSDRETILHLFDRIRKAEPSMRRFKRYEGELALESSRKDRTYLWLAMRHNNIRTGHVNPESMAQGYALHRLVLAEAPFHLTISPLDVDYVELLFGFDLECSASHDEVVAEALYPDTPLAELTRIPDTKLLDAQPVVGLSLSDRGDLQAYFEVKTRRRARRGGSKRYKDEPISIFLTLRRYGPVDRIEELTTVFDDLTTRAEQLATEHLVPHLLTPIARQITSRSA